MSDPNNSNHIANLLKEAVAHLRKVEDIFEDLEILNYKIQGDLYSLMEVCDANMIKIKNSK